MAYQGHGIHSSKESAPEESLRGSADCRRIVLKKNQALTVHARKGKNKIKDRPPKKFQKYQKKKQRNNSTIRCFSGQKVGHIPRNCPMVRDQNKNERNKRHHANAAEDEEPSQKKERNNNSEDEYSLISAVIGTVNHDNDTWLVNSGASKHMTGYKNYLSTLIERESHQKVKLGDD